MTNSVAIWLAALILLLLVVDGALNHWAATIFLSGKTLDLIEWVAFWR
ncbi:hypothetical protein [Paenirhodobacter sp.]